MARFLLITWDGGGVIPPQMAVVRRLAAAGHAVRVLSDPTVESEARQAGASFEPWRRAPHRRSRLKEDDLLRDYAYKNPLAYVRNDMLGYMARPGPEWTADCLDAIDAWQPDVVLYDFMTTLWGGLAAELRHKPAVALVTTPSSFVPSPGVPPMGFEEPATTPWGRSLHALVRGLSERLFDLLLPSINAVRAQHGLSPLRHALDQVRRADVIGVTAPAAFDRRGTEAPDNMRWFGRLLDDPTWAVPWVSPWPDDDARPLVLVGLSSTYMAQERVLQAAVDALAALPVRGLVTLGPAIDPSLVEPKGDVAVVASAPHGQVLPQASVMVTHCGYGSTLKGLAHGVPLVCAPLGRDQHTNAARVVHLGAGVRVGARTSAAALGAAVRKVLEQPTYREAAGQLAQRMATGQGDTDVVTLCEGLVGQGARAAG